MKNLYIITNDILLKMREQEKLMALQEKITDDVNGLLHDLCESIERMEVVGNEKEEA